MKKAIFQEQNITSANFDGSRSSSADYSGRWNFRTKFFEHERFPIIFFALLSQTVISPFRTMNM